MCCIVVNVSWHSKIYLSRQNTTVKSPATFGTNSPVICRLLDVMATLTNTFLREMSRWMTLLSCKWWIPNGTNSIHKKINPPTLSNSHKKRFDKRLTQWIWSHDISVKISFLTQLCDNCQWRGSCHSKQSKLGLHDTQVSLTTLTCVGMELINNASLRSASMSPSDNPVELNCLAAK